jgi:protein-disulfide isomerase
MTRFYWVLGAVAVLGVGAVGFSVSTAGGGGAATSPVEVPGLEDGQQLVEMAQGTVKGDENAPITIVEFADYQCPGCGQFGRIVIPQVVSSYVDTGEAQLVLYDMPLTSIHPHAFLAARAARCAGDQDRYWDYHDALYANQQEWSFVADASGHFEGYAEEIGLDAEEFGDCLNSDRHADVVTANMRLAEELGVRGTPTIMVSAGSGTTRRVDNNNFPSIAQAIQEVREAAGLPTPDTSGSGEEGGG